MGSCLPLQAHAGGTPRALAPSRKNSKEEKEGALRVGPKQLLVGCPGAGAPSQG